MTCAREFSDLALNVKADAMTALLDGGWLELHDATARPLARLGFLSPAFFPASEGVAVARPLAPEVDAPAAGKPASFVARTFDGEFVFGGTIGPPDDGSEYDLLVDGDVQRGGEVVVERLEYAERRKSCERCDGAHP